MTSIAKMSSNMAMRYPGLTVVHWTEVESRHPFVHVQSMKLRSEKCLHFAVFAHLSTKKKKHDVLENQVHDISTVAFRGR